MKEEDPWPHVGATGGRPSESKRRRSIRLSEFNYAQPNAYFVTICAAGRRCLFGSISDCAMRLNKIGRIVRDEWYRSVEIRREIALDEFIVMPNHLHGIVVIEDVTAAGGDRRSPLHRQGPVSRSLGSFVAGFKSAATRRAHEAQLCFGPIWQRNYFEHIVRSEKSLNTIRAYIAGNPNNWSTDRENPNAKVLLSSQADRS